MPSVARLLTSWVLCVAGLLPSTSATQAAEPDPEPDLPTVWALGDSITLGVGTDDRKIESYPAQVGALGYDVRAIGLRGQCLVVLGCHHATPMVDTAELVLDAAQPGDVLVLEGGTNDLERATDPQLKRGYRAVVHEGEAIGVQVIVATITPRSAVRSRPEPQRLRMNAWLRARDWMIVDFDARLERRTDHTLAPRFDSGDGLHPNAAGALAMARSLVKLLEQL